MLLFRAAILYLAANALAAGGEEAWSLQRLVTPPVPSVADVQNAVDAFVRASLAAKGLSPSPEADRRTLIRRLYFDLIGLPPTPDEVREFVAEPAPDAYERIVDRLLASPRYGERWARHWMDAVHFAETHGHDQDRIRPNAWPYRDYLITSFNADKPFARFLEEQIAGDVLFPDDPQATVALGFLAAGPWDESSLRDIREDTLDRQIARYLDRDDVVTTVMSTFASSTVHCARCHDHKFDPFPQEDYYALQAVFAGVDRANRVYDPDPVVHRERQSLLAQKRALQRGDAAFLAGLTEPAMQSQVAAWERSLAESLVQWTVIQPVEVASEHGSVLTPQSDGSVLASGPLPDRDTYTIRGSVDVDGITAVRIEVLTDETLPHKGPGRRENGNLHLSEVQLLATHCDATPARPAAFRTATADYNQTDWTIAHAIDGKEETAWGIHPEVGRPHEAVLELEHELASAAGLTFRLKQLHGRGHLIGRVRLSVTDATPPVRCRTLPAEITSILSLEPEQRTLEQQRKLAIHYLGEQIETRLSTLPAPQFIYAAASDFAPDGSHAPANAARPVHTLKRGDIRKPGDVAEPGALGCVDWLPARFPIAAEQGEGGRRAALARWLSDRENPLTWRSIVNRIWHHHFGRGLVETPNDFGKMGGKPSHLELLDWLAVWFRDGGGSCKKLHRLIVTSATYRQESRNLDAAVLIDAENRLLWRMNRQRLDAECVRDAILQISGRLDLRMGGPSDQNFDLKPGHHVTPLIDYAKFDLDSAAGRRRGIYRFLFRTLPDPFMDALDCPAGDQLTPTRNASVTVQQALAMWNSAFTARHAEHFAARLEQLASANVESQVTHAMEFALGRPPTAEESEEMCSYARRHGLANLCRVILNSNEFMFVN